MPRPRTMGVARGIACRDPRVDPIVNMGARNRKSDSGRDVHGANASRRERVPASAPYARRRLPTPTANACPVPEGAQRFNPLTTDVAKGRHLSLRCTNADPTSNWPAQHRCIMPTLRQCLNPVRSAWCLNADLASRSLHGCIMPPLVFAIFHCIQQSVPFLFCRAQDMELLHTRRSGCWWWHAHLLVRVFGSRPVRFPSVRERLRSSLLPLPDGPHGSP